MNASDGKGSDPSLGRGRKPGVRLAAGLAAFFLASGLGWAQDRGAAENRHDKSGHDEKAPPPGARDAKPRRLEAVTWNPVSHELTWIVAIGDNKASDSSKNPGKDTYLINMDNATMSFNGEKRRFSKQEAENVHVLMDILSKYAIESTVWWEDGQGQRLDDKGNPQPDNKKKSAPGSLHADGDGDGDVLHASAPANPRTEGDQMRDLRFRIAELEERLTRLERQKRFGSDSLDTGAKGSAIALHRP